MWQCYQVVVFVFQVSVQELMTNLLSKTPNYIRCIKVNRHINLQDTLFYLIMFHHIKRLNYFFVSLHCTFHRIQSMQSSIAGHNPYELFISKKDYRKNFTTR